MLKKTMAAQLKCSVYNASESAEHPVSVRTKCHGGVLVGEAIGNNVQIFKVKKKLFIELLNYKRNSSPSNLFL